jgi:hypothetical protein
MAAYRKFLIELNTYITSYIYPGVCPYFSQYQTYLEYLKTTNAAGFALYEKQLEYAKKKS